MSAADYIVLFIYFGSMAGIGLWVMRSVKKQEDYFMGGRQFGKLFQTFAAFGAGTGSADPVNTARGTFANGMSGMWGVMYWLFVTPIYWITAVWYRRMRCLTLGDWFVERYESKRIGVAYAIFGCFYYMVYGAMLFTAIGKVAVPLMGEELLGMRTEYVLVRPDPGDLYCRPVRHADSIRSQCRGQKIRSLRRFLDRRFPGHARAAARTYLHHHRR